MIDMLARILAALDRQYELYIYIFIYLFIYLFIYSYTEAVCRHFSIFQQGVIQGITESLKF